MSEPSCTAVIVASGSGKRLGLDKLLWPLLGEPVLTHTIRAFLSASRISAVVVVCPLPRWAHLPSCTSNKPLYRVDGGAERQDSVFCGLEAVPPDSKYVAVHDGARPLVTSEDIDACVLAAIEHSAAVLAHPAVDTMKRADGDGFCTSSVDRSRLWCMETPQVFRTDLLRAAFAAVIRDGISVTDEVSAVQYAGFSVKLVESTSPNPKITLPADLGLASALAEMRNTSRRLGNEEESSSSVTHPAYD